MKSQLYSKVVHMFHEHLHNPRPLFYNPQFEIPNNIKSFTVAKQHGRKHQQALCHHPTLPGNLPVAEPVPALRVREMSEAL